MILPGKRVPVRTHFTLVLSGKSIFYLPFPPLPFIIFIFIFYFFYFLFFFLGVCVGVRGGGTIAAPDTNTNCKFLFKN